MRSLEHLQRMFPDKSGIIFIDNDELFKEKVSREGYGRYFKDNIAGDFGHCTPLGDRLLAENIAGAILREIFSWSFD